MADSSELRRQFVMQWRRLGLYADGTLIEAMHRARSTARLTVAAAERPFEISASDALSEAVPVAAGFHGLGLRRGDVMVIQLPNCRENILAYLAAFMLGIVVVPVVGIYGAAELAFILNQTRARALLVPGRSRKIDFAERVGALGSVPTLERIIVAGDGDIPGMIHWSELRKWAARELPEQRIDPDEVALINFTSGTTASPKGVMHSHRSLYAEVMGFPAPQREAGDPPGLYAAPAGHIGNLVLSLRPLLRGTDEILMDIWDPAHAAELIRQHGIRHVGGAPIHLNGLLAVDGGPLPLRSALIGAAGVPPSLVQLCEERGIRAFRCYGSTEHPTVSSGSVEDDLHDRARTDGRILPGCAVRILDDDGEELPPGKRGEVVTMGPDLFRGYLDASLDRDGFTPDGWYRSGDIGIVDDRGFLTIVDRKKDIIIRGGENISSQEVEGVLARHPAVMEVAAVGWPDAKYGETVGVFVRLRPGGQLDIGDVHAHFEREGMARHKLPQKLVVLEDFPRTPAGKVIKATLRQRARAMQTGGESTP